MLNSEDYKTSYKNMDPETLKRRRNYTTKLIENKYLYVLVSYSNKEEGK
jgi:hypothetical protein